MRRLLLTTAWLFAGSALAQTTPEAYCASAVVKAQACEILDVRDHRGDVGAVSVHFCKAGRYGTAWAQPRDGHLVIAGRLADAVEHLLAAQAITAPADRRAALEARICPALPDTVTVAPERCFSRAGGYGCYN